MRPDWKEIREEYEKVDISALESVEYENRRLLPSAPGVYLFVRFSSVLYVGQSENIKNRCSKHLKAKEIPDLSRVRIHWIQCRSREMRFIERLLMCLYQPVLNYQKIIPVIKLPPAPEFDAPEGVTP